MFSNFRSKLLFFLAFSVLTLSAYGQISIGASNYSTLKAAFDDINAGVHTGSIAIAIAGNTTETTSCVLNSSGTGSSSYTGIAISTVGGPWTITSSLTASHLIGLNGVDNFTIDGNNNLTLENAGLGASTVIRLYNDATGNTIKNCNLLGSATASFGVVTFGSAITGGNGNDFNTIENCSIAAAGANFPLNGIYSLNTTLNTDNNNNTITGCRIFDHFNASNPFSGIQLNSGNSAWTITNNKIYQTVSRAVSSANTVSSILITAGSGYIISNNSIGFANSTGTGTYTMTSTVALRFVGINCNLVAGSATEINGNTISSISFTSSSGAATTNGVLCGINITGTGAANIGTTLGNTIGSGISTNSLVVTSTTTQALVVGVHASTTGTISIKNNTFGGFKSSGLTASVAGAVMGINISSNPVNATIENNGIGNGLANNMQAGNLTPTLTTGSSIAVGINIPTAASGSVAISSNTIQNFASYGTGNAVNSAFARGIATFSSTSSTVVYTINNNIISNLTTNGTYAAYGNGLLTACGIGLSGGLNSVISNNSISNISAFNAGTGSYTVGGISLGNASNTQIFNNRIFNLSNAGTSTATAAPAVVGGIVIRSAVASVSIYNNMITLGAGQSTNTSFIGIMGNHGSSPNPTNQNIYFNTINISGTVSAGAQPSFGIARTDFSVTARQIPMTIKNNLIVNTRTGGTGNHFAIANNYGATANATGWESNYNLLNANSATIGHWSTSQNFSAWQSASASDANSKSGIAVNFVNPSIGDLHLNMGVVPTGLESGGVDIVGFAVDIDSEARPGPSGSVNGGATAPDLGADEFDGKLADLTAPVLTLSPITASCSTADRLFSANIKDVSGVPLLGTLVPRVYFRKGTSGTWYSAAGILNNGTAFDGNWDFVVNHTLLGGVNSGDLVQYYIIAQDIAGNLSSSPLGATAFDVNTVSVAPPSPLAYQIGYATFGGTFAVGSAQAAPFNTLTNAINTFNNACLLTGPVVFELTDATYSTLESFPLTIRKHASASATNTLTIRPAAGNTAAITGMLSNPQLFTIYNSFTTIDGSNNGSTSRNLILGGATSTLAFYSNTNSAAITDCTVKNTTILNGAQTASGIEINDIAPGSTGGFFNNMVIQNNDLQKALNGIYMYANPNTANNGSGTSISQNNMTATGSNAIRINGVFLQGVNGANISGNTFSNFEGTTLENDNAIILSGVSNTTITNNNISNLSCSSVGTAAPTGIALNTNCTNIAISGNEIAGIFAAGTNTPSGIAVSSGTGFIINANKIINVKNTNPGGWGAVGISMAGANSRISNNFVSEIAAYGFANFGLTDNGNGIVLFGGSNHEIYHNTVVLNTSQTDVNGTPAALLVTFGITASATVAVKNNILVNNQTIGVQHYTLVCTALSTVFSDVDYNDYFSSGPNLGYVSATPCANIADMQTYFGGNTNSFIENPVFVSGSDLHLNTGTTPSKLESGAVLIPGINTDVDGDSRPGPLATINGGGSAPDVGADEYDGVKIPVLLSAKVFISGVDTTSGLMTDYLRTVNFPTADPYANNANLYYNQHVNNLAIAAVSPVVLATSGNNAIVDWVFLELRTGSSGATTVVATKSALLQKDGDIVSTDGVSPLSFNTAPGNYVIGVRHRNHLRFETDQPILLSTVTTSMDFTNNSITLWGNSPSVLNQVSSNKWIMIGGDANADQSIDALDTPDWEAQNGLFDDYFMNADYNLDGSIDALDSIIWETNNGKFV
ncbi:MAG: beta strand repeat-containing protein [Saprospiraceae bacterium]